MSQDFFFFPFCSLSPFIQNTFRMTDRPSSSSSFFFFGFVCVWLSLAIRGDLKRTPKGTKQLVELKATDLLFHGPCDGAVYPIAKKKTSFEFLRSHLHLRARTNTISAVARVRNALSLATHLFFQQNGFFYVHTPIIGTSDAEGAGEAFQVRPKTKPNQTNKENGTGCLCLCGMLCALNHSTSKNK